MNDRDQIAELILVSPESGKKMVISSKLKCDGDVSTFQVSTHDRSETWKVTLKISEQV